MTKIWCMPQNGIHAWSFIIFLVSQSYTDCRIKQEVEHCTTESLVFGNLLADVDNEMFWWSHFTAVQYYCSSKGKAQKIRDGSSSWRSLFISTVRRTVTLYRTQIPTSIWESAFSPRRWISYNVSRNIARNSHKPQGKVTLPAQRGHFPSQKHCRSAGPKPSEKQNRRRRTFIRRRHLLFGFLMTILFVEPGQYKYN